MNTLGKKIATVALSGALLIGGMQSGLIVSNNNSNVAYAEIKAPTLDEIINTVKKSQSQYHYGIAFCGSLSDSKLKKDLRKVLDANTVEGLPEKGITMDSCKFKTKFKPDNLRPRSLTKYYFPDLDYELVIRCY